MNRQHPTLSIGLPVDNGANYLSEALDSILGQTFTDFEPIVFDNASDDETEQIKLALMGRFYPIGAYFASV